MYVDPVFSEDLFTWREDDPSTRIMLASRSFERDLFSAFSLDAKVSAWSLR